ncbi:hypothetical protein CHS0354_009376 [Potamilus streckersoni]|uniref:Enoyl-CoA hydratase/isomerase n=1 Tax=Potamilus streckersoni TaxID=2493646 RepID=A0AAE0T4M8_9BIVA|nr:hypothetical protein CHS0354_009376 [Potamilus streckersoni]
MEGLTVDYTDSEFAIITWNWKENRFRLSTIHAWHKILDEVLSKPDIKILITIGSGKFFSNGIDLEWLATQSTDEVQKYIDALNSLMLRLMVYPIPTVAVVNGHAFGAGAFLAIAHDYRVMRSDRGWLCWPETRLRMKFRPKMLDIISAKIQNGKQQREAIIYAKRLKGQDALELGLVDVIGNEKELLDQAKRLGKNVLGSEGLDRTTLAMMKRDVYGKYISFDAQL